MTDATPITDDEIARQAQKSTTGRPALRPPTRPPWHGMPDLLRVVWTMPRATIRWLLDHGDHGLWIALALCTSLVAALSSTALWGRIDLLGPGSWPRTIALGVPLWFVAYFVTAFGLAQIGQANRLLAARRNDGPRHEPVAALDVDARQADGGAARRELELELAPVPLLVDPRAHEPRDLDELVRADRLTGHGRAEQAHHRERRARRSTRHGSRRGHVARTCERPDERRDAHETWSI